MPGGHDLRCALKAAPKNRAAAGLRFSRGHPASESVCESRQTQKRGAKSDHQSGPNDDIKGGPHLVDKHIFSIFARQLRPDN
jgi:hypothetical protein